MKLGAAVLCGGKSSRMGRAKAWLPFGPEFLLQRVVRVLREVTDAVVVVAAPGQAVPPLADDVRIAHDEVEGRGPLGGLATGLAALAPECDAVFLSACDAPFLRPAFVRLVASCLAGPTPPGPPSLKGRGETASVAPCASPTRTTRNGAVSPLPFREGGPGGVGRFAAAVPYVGGRLHPLSAAYRVEVLPVVHAMLAANELRMTDLVARVPGQFLGPDELTPADPGLRSLRNLNTPDEYAAALRDLRPS